ncbi:rod shape-determining protein [Endozoicomonas elysicola]|uniref:rod shape-determining protein n=1 Tax=Endozoicomonas elysicola TaxID=305900 RepID=UPI00037A8CD7|nr:rod shape-determining protein [Endozoicomonas elysicola]
MINTFSPTLYVQIWQHRIKVSDVKTGQIFETSSEVGLGNDKKGHTIITSIGQDTISTECGTSQTINPFLHPRTIISNFPVATLVLQHAFQRLLSTRSFAPSPVVIMHPMENIEGGLTMIEKRALTELALGSGARKVTVYTGAELMGDQVNFDAIQERAVENVPDVSLPKKSSAVRSMVFLSIVILTTAYLMAGS